MQIDATYFIGEINIPNVDQPSVLENLNLFIKKYEKRFLILLLGDTVYDDFINGLSEDPIPVKWSELRDRLINSEDKESPIANYVYYWYMRDQSTTSTGIGETKPNAENASIVRSSDKQVRGWNEMSDWICINRAWFNDFYSLNGFIGGYYNIHWKYLKHYDPFAKINTLNL